ncbi:MAG: stalk domain-containing protein [Clostridia bacterium]|nr:stalk domain-containing protein [Clostridia bacterium]
MKKIIFLITAFLAFGICTNAYAARVICDENYENYNIGDRPKGWDGQDSVENGTYYQVEQDPNDPTNKVIALHTNDKDLTEFAYYFDEPFGGIATVTFRVRMGDSKEFVSWIGWINECFANMLYKTSFTMVTANGQKVMDNFAANYTKWYDMRYEIDFLSQTFSYYFDGKLIHDNISFLVPDTNQINRIRFKLQTNQPTYMDDLKITMEGGISKIYTKIEVDADSDYKYAVGQKTIQNVFDETTTKNFMKYFKFIDGADYGLYEADGVTPFNGTYINNGIKLVVESPDKRQRSETVIYTRKRFMGTHTAKMAKSASCFAVGSEYVLNNNKRTLIDENDESVKCYCDNGEIYVPLRRLCEAFGIDVSFNAEKGCAVLDGTKEVFAVNKNGTMFIPSSQIEELTGKKIIYNNGKLIVIRSNDLIMRKTVRSTVMEELYSRLINE